MNLQFSFFFALAGSALIEHGTEQGRRQPRSPLFRSRCQVNSIRKSTRTTVLFEEAQGNPVQNITFSARLINEKTLHAIHHSHLCRSPFIEKNLTDLIFVNLFSHSGNESKWQA